MEEKEVMAEETKRFFREILVSYTKRLIYEVEFLQGLVTANNQAFDSVDDMIIQFDRAKKEIQAVLDYNFTVEELEETEMLSYEGEDMQLSFDLDE